MNEQLNLPGFEGAQTSMYTFPAAFGGVVQSKTPPIILGKLRELRLAVGGLAAKKAQGGPLFPVRSAKELAQKLAQALCDLNLSAPVISQEITHLDTDRIPANTTASGKPVFRTLLHVKATVRVIAEDGSYIDMVGSGHGGDDSDKSGGKASTYAWKDALLKGLTIPDADMVDTDDAALGQESEAKTATKAPKKAEAKAAQPSELDAVIARINAADAAGLETIREGIKSGTIVLAGADKLRASTAFVARSKALEAAAKAKAEDEVE